MANERDTVDEHADVEELRSEIERLHQFILAIANRLAAASEVLGMLAERKEARKK